MWIISKRYGAFNTDNISAIQKPDPEDDFKFIYACDGARGNRLTEGLDNYQKILKALVNGDNFVEVS